MVALSCRVRGLKLQWCNHNVDIALVALSCRVRGLKYNVTVMQIMANMSHSLVGCVD